jgi:hypothetical protein
VFVIGLPFMFRGRMGFFRGQNFQPFRVLTAFSSALR